MIENDSRPPMAAPAPLAYAEAEREPVQRPTLDLLLLLPWVAAVAGLFLDLAPGVESPAEHVWQALNEGFGQTPEWIEAAYVWPLGLSVLMLGWKVRLLVAPRLTAIERLGMTFFAIAGALTPLLMTLLIPFSSLMLQPRPHVVGCTAAALATAGIVWLQRRGVPPARVLIAALGGAYAAMGLLLQTLLLLYDNRLGSGSLCINLAIAGWIVEMLILLRQPQRPG